MAVRYQKVGLSKGPKKKQYVDTRAEWETPEPCFSLVLTSCLFAGPNFFSFFFFFAGQIVYNDPNPNSRRLGKPWIVVKSREFPPPKCQV